MTSFYFSIETHLVVGVVVVVLLLPLCALAQLLLCPAWLCSAAPYMTVKTKEVKISGDSGSPIISFIKLLRPIQAKA